MTNTQTKISDADKAEGVKGNNVMIIDFDPLDIPPDSQYLEIRIAGKKVSMVRIVP